MIGWIYDGDTPAAPNCGVAVLLPGLTASVELFRLYQRRFGAQAGVPLPDYEAQGVAAPPS